MLFSAWAYGVTHIETWIDWIIDQITGFLWSSIFLLLSLQFWLFFSTFFTFKSLHFSLTLEIVSSEFWWESQQNLVALTPLPSLSSGLVPPLRPDMWLCASPWIVKTYGDCQMRGMRYHGRGQRIFLSAIKWCLIQFACVSFGQSNIASCFNLEIILGVLYYSFQEKFIRLLCKDTFTSTSGWDHKRFLKYNHLCKWKQWCHSLWMKMSSNLALQFHLGLLETLLLNKGDIVYTASLVTWPIGLLMEISVGGIHLFYVDNFADLVRIRVKWQQIMLSFLLQHLKYHCSICGFCDLTFAWSLETYGYSAGLMHIMKKLLHLPTKSRTEDTDCCCCCFSFQLLFLLKRGDTIFFLVPLVTNNCFSRSNCPYPVLYLLNDVF